MLEFSPENLRNPARNRRAGLMRQFRSSQLNSILIFFNTWFRGDEQYLLIRVEVEEGPTPECSRSRKSQRTFSDPKNTDVPIRPVKSTVEFPTPRWY